MSHRFINIFTVTACVAALMALGSCKKASTEHDAQISNFAIRSSDNAPDLGSITFTVDTLNMVIYNEDSVAYTSNLHKTLPVITCFSTPSEVRINDITWNQQDSVDVSAPFKLTIVASDKKMMKDFYVTVKQHKVDSRTIGWTKLNCNLNEDDYTYGKVVRTSSAYFFVAELAAETKQAVYKSTDMQNWELISTSTPVIQIGSVFAPNSSIAPDAVYAIGLDGAMYVLDANHGFFAKTKFDVPEGMTLVDIIGEEFDGVLLSAKVNGDNRFFTYSYEEGFPTTISTPLLPSDFPTDKSSAKCNVYFDQFHVTDVFSSYLIGGANSKVLSTVFACEYGISWVNVIKDASHGIQPIKNGAAAWYDKRLFVFGGRSETEEAVKGYVSSDTGFSWAEMSDCEFLPADATISYEMSAVVDKDGGYIYIIGGKSIDGAYHFCGYKGRAIHMDFIRK